MRYCHTCHQLHGDIACEIVASVIEGILAKGVVKYADQIQVEGQHHGIMRVAIIHDSHDPAQQPGFFAGVTL